MGRPLWVDTDNRHIMSMKSQGFPRTPQDIIEEYNGCSVPQYTRYPFKWLLGTITFLEQGAPIQRYPR